MLDLEFASLRRSKNISVNTKSLGIFNLVSENLSIKNSLNEWKYAGEDFKSI